MRARRHGDPEQPAIQVKTLRPLVREIESIVAKDTTGKIEAVAVQLSMNLREYAESVVQDRERYEAVQGRTQHGRRVGRIPFPGWTAFAARELLRSLNAVTPTRAACVAGALFLLRHREPARFVSEDGWLGTFVRSWRKCCGKIAFGSYWDHRWNRKRPVYKELPIRASREIGLLLVTTYAPFAARLIAHEERKKRVPQVIRQYLDDAFTSLEQSNQHQQE
jgi:hypothetical protein